MKTLVKTLSVALFSSLISSPAFAQFVYPSASFFYPPASLNRGGFSPNPIQVLENNEAQVFGFLLSTSNFEPELGTKENPVTILAPTNEAFAELSTEVRDKLADPVQMQKFLQYHLVPGQVS